MKSIFYFANIITSLCSFCSLKDETVIHIFVHCSKNKRLWCIVTDYFKPNLGELFRGSFCGDGEGGAGGGGGGGGVKITPCLKLVRIMLET